ncbi:unnamed protein product [Symbiodinium sp. KB8]|nr:unnamed protein product [Symbiodinium sp. KB8]
MSGKAKNGTRAPRRKYAEACLPCAKVKKRCIGGVPCQRCERLGIECVLRKPKKRQRDQGPDEAASSSITQQAGATASAAEEHVSKAARTAAHQAAPGAFANQLQRHHPAIGPEQGVTEVAGAVQVTSPQDPQSKQAAATHPFAPLVRDVHDKPETLAGLEGEDGEEVMALQSALAASPAAQQLAAFEPMYGFPTATFANLALEAFLRWTPGDKATIGMPASGAVMWAMPGVALQQALLMRGMVEAGLPRLRWESTVLRTVYEHADSFVNPLKSEFEAVNVTYDAHMRVWPFRGGRTLHMSVLDSSFCGTLTQQQKERAMVFTRELSNAFEACCDEVLQTGPGASAGAAPRGAFATEVARTASSMSTHDDVSAGGTGAESSSAGSSATQPAAISFEGRSCAGEGGRVISVRFPRPSRDMMFLVHMAFLWNWVLSGTPCSVAATLRAAKVAVAEPGDATPPLPLPTLQCPMPSQVAHQYSHILHGMQVLRAVQEGRSHDTRAAFPHFAAAGIHARLDASGVVRVSVDPTGTVGLRTLTPAANAARSMASLYESIFT